jgi:hypothetical protein
MLVLRLGSAVAVLTLERKSMPIVAWYMLSKESYMNRVIKEVFPTVGIVVSDVGTEGSVIGPGRTTLLS